MQIVILKHETIELPSQNHHHSHTRHRVKLKGLQLYMALTVPQGTSTLQSGATWTKVWRESKLNVHRWEYRGQQHFIQTYHQLNLAGRCHSSHHQLESDWWLVPLVIGVCSSITILIIKSRTFTTLKLFYWSFCQLKFFFFFQKDVLSTE